MTAQDLSNKIALVTGASRGIGHAAALELSRRGAHVVALARSQGALEELDDAITAQGGTCTLVPMDLTKNADIDKLGASLFERFGKLDIWVSAAATMGILTPAHHVELKDLDKTMRLNFASNTRLIRSLDPLLRASDAGRALFLSGAITTKPPAYFGVYAASKAALETFVRAYAAELGQTNIRANIAHLPPVKTTLLETAFPGGFPGKVLQPNDVAPFIADHVSADIQDQGQTFTFKPKI